MEEVNRCKDMHLRHHSGQLHACQALTDAHQCLELPHCYWDWRYITCTLFLGISHLHLPYPLGPLQLRKRSEPTRVPCVGNSGRYGKHNVNVTAFLSCMHTPLASDIHCFDLHSRCGRGRAHQKRYAAVCVGGRTCFRMDTYSL
jgi:hypothetical protein